MALNQREYKKFLEAELEAARAEMEQLASQLEIKGEYGPGRGDPAIYQWEFNLARYQRAKEKIRSIKQALERVEKGTYGLCQSCGGAIESARLEVLPDTELCSRCAQSSRRPTQPYRRP